MIPASKLSGLTVAPITDGKLKSFSTEKEQNRASKTAVFELLYYLKLRNKLDLADTSGKNWSHGSKAISKLSKYS